MKAVFLDYNTIGPQDLDMSPLMKCLPELKLYDATSRSEVPDRIASAEYILTNKVELNAANLSRARTLKFIGLTATGADNIDSDYTRKRNIRVCNIRSYCTQSVVEHVFSSVLNLSHNINHYQQSVKNGDWQKADDFCLINHPIRELSTMTIGIIGYGELGKNVALMAKSFGMKILINTRSKSTLKKGDEITPLNKLFKEADVISLHCPLTNETRNMISENELSLMRNNAILINTARGALVDSQALLEALVSKKIAGAAIDVLPQEPPVDGNCLLDYQDNNLILTPHIAWATSKARQNAIDQLAKTICAFQAGKKLNAIT